MKQNVSSNSYDLAVRSDGGDGGGDDYVRVAVGTTLAAAERVLIVATLRQCHGNKTRAANILGVSLKTLYNRINEYRSETV